MKKYDKLIFVSGSDTSTSPMAEALLESKYLLEDILTEGICKKDLDTFYDVVRKMSENISSNEKNYVHRGGGKQ